VLFGLKRAPPLWSRDRALGGSQFAGQRTESPPPCDAARQRTGHEKQATDHTAAVTSGGATALTNVVRQIGSLAAKATRYEVQLLKSPRMPRTD
jgi:hypothetical protein